MAQLPEGEPAPADGVLPPSSRDAWGGAPFGVYVHVPFCTTRCGYCDFNTYTAVELGEQAGDRDGFAHHLISELGLARRVLGRRDVPVATVFFGGGTPTLLTSGTLGRVVRAIDGEFGLAPDAEVTVEANPDSVTPGSLAQLRGSGFTRISFGMQSASPHVLAVLDRTHTPGRALSAVEWARHAGFDHVSLDLIYGTPGETLADWQRTVEVALGSGVDHISAYALIVEPGTRLARRVRRGEVEAPDDDLVADMYEVADSLFHEAGLAWYELSNWARPGHECLHNIGYWQGADWWGTGPGAHSHVQGVRWWNAKHPSDYVKALRSGRSPAVGREVLTVPTQQVERLLLGIRLVDGVSRDSLTEYGRQRLPDLVSAGLCVAGDERVTLTRAGRLMADHVVRALLPP